MGYNMGTGGDEMNTYVTGAMIKALREQKNCTQQQLADQLHLSAKTISKWETGGSLR